MTDNSLQTRSDEWYNLLFKLSQEGIRFDVDIRVSNWYQIFYPNKESFSKRIPGEEVRSLSCSVIIDPDGKLEILGLLTEQEKKNGDILTGLSAEDVYERIRKAEDERLSIFRHFGPNEDHTVEDSGWF